MKLTEYARRIGVSRGTAYRWFRAGQINGAYQMPTGTIIIPDEIFSSESNKSQKTVVYARVSNSNRGSADLEAQVKRLTDFCIANGWAIDSVVNEVASGLNDHRPKLEKILRDPDLTRLVVEHKDRLTRFGFNYLQILSDLRGVDLVVMNRVDEDKDDLVEDFVSIITSFCARIYGSRRGSRKTEALTKELSHD